MFKLLAFRVLDDCAKHIQKCLKKDVYYYFCTDYRFEIKDRVYKGSRYTEPLQDTFFMTIPNQHFYTKKSDVPYININAVVGKNGDGKSTIVELVIRLINNYIARHISGNLLEIKEVYAELYFLLDGKIYRLYATKDGEGINMIADVTKEPIQAETPYYLKTILPVGKEVFKVIYTLVSNYSHYAYNVYDFQKEWEPLNNRIKNEKTDNERCWLFKIFHKNDGYTTPLSLHPYRYSGNIDINKEVQLAKQRLMYLFVKSSDEPNAFRNILGKKAIGIRMTPTKMNKLYERSIRDFFYAHQESDTSLDWALNPIKKDISDIKKLLRPRHPLSRNQIDGLHYTVKHLKESYVRDVQTALKKILLGEEWNEQDREQFTNFQSRAIQAMGFKVKVQQSNLRQYLKQIGTLRDYIEDASRYDDGQNELAYIIDMLPTKEEIDALWVYKSFNLRQMARLYTIFSIAVHNQIDLSLLHNIPMDGMTNKQKAEIYKVYKTLSIFETYPAYQNIAQSMKDKWGIDSCYEYSPVTITNLFMQLDKDRVKESHVIRKWVQIDNYLSNPLDIYTDEPDLNIKTDDNESRIKSINCLNHYYGADNIDSFHLIPPIFDYDIVFQDGESYMEMSLMSSGEKQLLHNIGAIIYHLQNIESTHQYSSVNLILEEIELYYHPEYQRKFIYRLLDQIYGLQLHDIKNINVTFVTHSPFVLSDIPKCNVLFLNDGNPDYRMQENTFGANIHSLLKNGFFLPNLPMGEFAYNKINELFRKLNSNDYDHSEKNMNRIRQEIALVGEPYLREQLYRLLPK